ncbi:hypothetical protein [Flavobacterium hydrophilum]|uniref:Uncharacterized protein n=1 Tax=Flavobacterium hydrophilum TaxID=2211445 RepID=A0A2V4C3L5_9FLAO|nr:hypothetical protein [Flavobacterium hydrophilum]PXY44500.1 hypothetical protein DMB68_13615 [Flavobacterium hydrophilum]
MSEIQISCDPSGNDSSKSKIAIIGHGMSHELNHMIRDLKTRENIVVIDDVDESISNERIEVFKKNYKKWIEHYFPHFSDENFANVRQFYFHPARNYGRSALINSFHKKLIKPVAINRKVKKRYIKCPKITERVSLKMTINLK